MRRYLLAASAAVALAAALPSEAAAFGDQCYGDVKARGSVQGSMSSARNAAIAAWESAASRRYGSRFANWYYSGDRTIDCSWDNSGRRIQCTALAGPCGRKR
jgi:hypothetical protein